MRSEAESQGPRERFPVQGSFLGAPGCDWEEVQVHNQSSGGGGGSSVAHTGADVSSSQLCALCDSSLFCHHFSKAISYWMTEIVW